MNDMEMQLELLNKKTLSLEFRFYNIFKHIFDFIIGFIGTILTIPFIVIVKMIYLLSGDFSPIFFVHKRIGKNGEIFNMYKFRTMVPNSAEILKELLKDPEIKKEWQENHKLDNDPRITKVGKILRKTSLDELPQFLNILKGDMSLIGPRPLIQEEVDAYGARKDALLSVRPGLTGWWACNGRSCTTNKERMNLELYYVSNYSLKLDIKIFFLTIVKVLKRDGAK